MAREYGKLWFRLFADEHFCAQPILDKLLYTVLIGQPAFNYAGLSPIQLRKWAKGCRPAALVEIKAALIRLERNRYVFADSDTEEILIRSYIRNDSVDKQPNTLIGALRSASAVESPKLAAVLLGELDRIMVPLTAKPDLRERMQSVFAETKAKLTTLSEGLGDPFREPFGEDFPEGLPRPGEMEPLAEGLTEGLGEPPVVVVVGSSASLGNLESFKDKERGRESRPSRTKRKRPEVPLPAEWRPTERHRELAKAKGLDLDLEARKFRLHAEEKDRRAVVWNSAFTRWLEIAHPRPVNNSGRSESGRSWQD